MQRRSHCEMSVVKICWPPSRPGTALLGTAKQLMCMKDLSGAIFGNLIQHLVGLSLSCIDLCTRHGAEQRNSVLHVILPAADRLKKLARRIIWDFRHLFEHVYFVAS